jgi:hypothetical protein
MAIRTNYKNTISMTIEDGDMFIDSGTTEEVLSKKNDRYLGYITSEYFDANKYIRTVEEQIIYVCPFLRD